VGAKGLTTISYRLADGSYADIKVSEKVAAGYREILRNENRIERKARRREISLEMLLEQEERQDNHGALESKCLKRNQELFSIVSKEPGPLEVLIEREEYANKPLVRALYKGLGLTGYQRKVAVEYYLNHKTQARIAKEMGVSAVSVNKLIKKVQKKALTKFM